jgi:ornithine cyclodeaminase/alanine dehydrogenase-like protein (mu-crystallin family)
MTDIAEADRFPKPARILRQSEIAALMDPSAYLSAVEAGFRSLASGETHVPMPMHIAARDGGFHAKGASVALDRSYVALKLNGNFPGNPRRNGLPAIQGVVLLCDAADGSLLAIMDSIEITSQRTAATSALAARLLARPDVDCIAICGCGQQGRAHLAAMTQILPVRRALVWDRDAQSARAFAEHARETLDLDVTAVPKIRDATLSSSVIVTVTPARSPFLTRDCVAAGAFIAAVGADSPEKSELAPELLAASTIVVDSLAQCAVMGDLHHALEAGAVTLADVHAELGEIVAGRKFGRTRPDEIIVFDSTGFAVEDAASAAWAYERALAKDVGLTISLGAL